MTPTEFCYWLQGFFEVVQPKSLDKKQVALIREKIKEALPAPKVEIKTEVKISPDPGKRRSAYDLSSATRLDHLRGQRYC